MYAEVIVDTPNSITTRSSILSSNKLKGRNNTFEMNLPYPLNKEMISYIKTIKNMGTSIFYIITGENYHQENDITNLNSIDNEYSFVNDISNDLCIENDINTYTNSKGHDEDVMIMNININSIVRANLDKLQLISELKYNWNLYGAKPISKELVDIMRSLIYKLEYQPEIFPTACESIQFEYEKDNGDYVEFELVDNDTIEIFRMYSNGSEKYDSCKPNADTINKILREFYGL